MAVQKVTTTLSNAITLTAGSGQTTSSVATTLLGWHKVVHIKLTNGATAPTTPATAEIQGSPDNINWYTFQSGFTGSAVNNGVVSSTTIVWSAVEYVRILWTAGDTQDVTATAVMSEALEISESTTDPSSNLIHVGDSSLSAVRIHVISGGCEGNAIGVSNTGNTAGNTGLSNTDWVFAASNGITASESTTAGGPNTIWFINPAQTSQSAIKGLGVSNTGNTAGNTGLSTGIDWVIAGSNNITASESTVGGGPNTIWISGPGAQTTQSAIKGLGVSNTGSTAGNTGISTGIDWVIAGTNNITASESTVGGGPNTIWFSGGAAQSSQSAIKGLGVSNTGNTAGNTGLSTGIDWVIAGSNLTASESTTPGGPNTIWISGTTQSNQSAIKGLGVSNTGSTAGNTGISTGIDWVIAASNNITASESTAGGGPNTIWFSGGAAQSNQSAIKGLGVSNTGNTAGNTGLSTGIDWVIAGSNLTASESTVGGGPNTIWISGQSSQSAIKGLGVSNTGNTAGNTGISTGIDWVIAGSNLTASESTTPGGPNTIWISGQSSQSAIKGLGVSNTGNTAGNTGLSTGINWVIAASNSVTASESTTPGGPNTIWFSGANQTNQSAIQGLGVSTMGNTAGNTGLSTGIDWVIAGSDGLTVSESTVGGGPNTIWISGNTQSSQSAIKGLGVSNTGNTAGDTGLSTGIDWVIAGSNSITLSQSTTAGGPNTMWISGPNITFFKAGISNLGNTAGTSTLVDQRMVFVGSNNISISQTVDGAIPSHSATMTIAPVFVSSYVNSPNGLYGLSNGLSSGSISQSWAVAFQMPQPISISFLRFPIQMTTNSSLIATSSASAKCSAEIYSTWNAVVYSLATGANSKSLSSVASGQALFTQGNSISVAANGTQYSITQYYTYQVEGSQVTTSTGYSKSTSNYAFSTTNWHTLFSTLRWLDINFANSLSAGPYWLLVGGSTSTSVSGNVASLSNMTNCNVRYNIMYGIQMQSSQWGVFGSTNASSGGDYQGYGLFTTAGGGTTNSLPLSAITQGTVANMSNVRPYFLALRSA